jgi:hypothetical protein
LSCSLGFSDLLIRQGEVGFEIWPSLFSGSASSPGMACIG